MVKLVYGTTNPGKLQHMRDMLDGLGIEIIGLNDIDVKVNPVDESGNDPLQNARIKALAYYEATQMPVFSCDSGLFIDGLSAEEQPGVHVRRVNGKELTDGEMIEHYAQIAQRLGGQAKARYKNAICLVMNEHTIHEYDGDDISTGDFILTSQPHVNRVEGFPLDSLSMDIATGQYYMDLVEDLKNDVQDTSENKETSDHLETSEKKEAIDDNENTMLQDLAIGFRRFFSRNVLNCVR